MGVKGDNVLLAGGERGGRSPPKKVAKAAKQTFAAVPDLLTLKQKNTAVLTKTAPIQYQGGLIHIKI